MAIGSVSTANFAAAMKQIYPQKRVELIFYKNHPFMAKVSKREDFYGYNQVANVDNTMAIAVSSSPPSGGRSATFANAQANISSGLDERFAISRKSDYQLWELQNEVIEASSRDIGAIMKVLKFKGDGALMNLSRNLSGNLYGNGGGARGEIATISVGGLITLANPSDIVHFENEMTLNAADWDGTGAAGAIRAGVDSISAIDRAAGTIQLLGGAVPGGWTAGPPGDFLFQSGDILAAGGDVITGLAGWLPTAAPVLGGPAFFGLDRGVDPTRLAGSRFNGLGLPIEEALKRISTLIVRNGGRPDMVFLNPLDYERLELSLEGRARFETMTTQVGGKRSAQVGFDSMIITTTAGKANVVADVDCPQGTGYMLQMDTWEMHHLKGLPHMITRGAGQGGGRMGVTTDTVEFRAVYRGNLACIAPGYNGVVTL